VTSATDSGDHLVVDAGRHGYLNGGHAHADALSVVLTLRHRPLLVDPGTPTYTMDREMRDDSRTSVGHNTVTLDGLSSALPDGPFRWRSHADARLELARYNSRFTLIEATHDGYQHARHRRTVLASDRGYLFFDQITGEGEHHAAQHWHLEPGWQVGCEAPRSLRLTHDDGERAWLLHDCGELSLINGDESSPLGWVSPAYGVRVPAWSARITHTGLAPFTLVAWCGMLEHAETPTCERIPCESGGESGAVAVRVRSKSSEVVSIVRPGDALGGSGSFGASTMQTDARALQGAFDNGVWSSACLAEGRYFEIGDELSVDADAVVPDLHVSLIGDRLELSASVPPARLRMSGPVLQQVRWIVGNDHTLRRLDNSHAAVVLTAPDWSGPVASAGFQDQYDVRYRRVR
jgi:hypothetical protein